MATEASEASHFSQARHFYLAVDRLEFKMETLVDLLNVAGQRPSLPMVVCCSSRDELDIVCSAVANLPFISLSSLYSDLAETERSRALEKFRQAALKWNQGPAAQLEDQAEVAESEFRSNMIVVTDACLPFLALGEAPIAARMLINYQLPTKKETYIRRMTTCLAADGIVINMVVGGEVVTLNNIEESSNLLIAEMPINLKINEPHRYIIILVFRSMRYCDYASCTIYPVRLVDICIGLDRAFYRASSICTTRKFRVHLPTFGAPGAPSFANTNESLVHQIRLVHHIYHLYTTTCFRETVNLELGIHGRLVHGQMDENLELSRVPSKAATT